MPTGNKRKPKANRQLKRWVLGLWIAAFLLAIGMIVLIFAQATVPVSMAAITREVTLSPSSTRQGETATLTPSPTGTATTAVPTSTPSPSPTPSPTETIPSRTPFPPTTTPQPANPTTIGHSVAGRRIQVYRFGNGPQERLIIAGIHGGYEWNTIALANELIAHLQDHPDSIPDDVSLYILPNLNPDGEARSHRASGRANERGVDLNRNFPALWQENWSRSGCWDYEPITAGSHPASEPETLALMGFIQRRNIDALISYHSAALGIFAGGQPPDPASLDLAASIAAVSEYPYPPIDTGCQFSGQLIDWASQEGIAAVDIELTNHTNTDFEQNLAILTTFLDWKMKR
jgi:predicted deacylase